MALRPPSLNARCISKMVDLFSALRAASGDPPGFPEYPGANLPLMRPLMTWGTVSRLGLACIVFPWFCCDTSQGNRSNEPLERPFALLLLLDGLRPTVLSFQA